MIPATALPFSQKCQNTLYPNVWQRKPTIGVTEQDCWSCKNMKVMQPACLVANTTTLSTNMPTIDNAKFGQVKAEKTSL